MYRLASTTLPVNHSLDSKAGLFVVTIPKTTHLSLGTSRSGSNEPERASSYSSSKRSAFTRPNNSRLIAP
jgi:hypothetical protein